MIKMMKKRKKWSHLMKNTEMKMILRKIWMIKILVVEIDKSWMIEFSEL
jgi:hypothetical protein